MKKTMFVAIAILAIVLGIVAYASAAGSTATSTVTVNALVNPHLTLTVTPVGLDSQFSGVDVMGTYTRNVAVSIDSNRGGTLTAVWGGAAMTDWNLSNTYASRPFVKAQNQDFGDTISFAPDYDTPSLDTDTVFTLTYTATQI